MLRFFGSWLGSCIDTLVLKVCIVRDERGVRGFEGRARICYEIEEERSTNKVRMLEGHGF